MKTHLYNLLCAVAFCSAWVLCLLAYFDCLYLWKVFTMKRIYIAHGYNSFTNKAIQKAFTTESEADKFLEGLTDPKLQIVSYRSTVELLNHFLKV